MHTLAAPVAPRRRLHPLLVAVIVLVLIPAVIVSWVIAAAAVTGLAEAVSGVTPPAAHAVHTVAPTVTTTPATPTPQAAVQPAQAAPTASTPHPQEDDPGFDCRTSTQGLCGPGNDQHVAPGCYSGGHLVAAWDPAMYGSDYACAATT